MSLRCPECEHRVDPRAPVCPSCGYRFRLERFERVIPLLRRPERQWEGRLSLRQRLWAVLTVPAVAFWDIAREPDNQGPFLIFLGNILSVSLFYSAMVVHLIGENLLGLLLSTVGVILVYSFLFLIWNLVYLGVIHAIVRLSGREGIFAETFLMGQYASLPLLIANILSLGLLMVGLPYVSISEFHMLAFQPVWIIVWSLTSAAQLWGALLLALGIRERYQFSTGISLLITFTVTAITMAVAWGARWLSVLPLMTT